MNGNQSVSEATIYIAGLTTDIAPYNNELLNSSNKMDSIWKEKYEGNDERSNFYFKAIYVGEEFEEEIGNEVLVADDKERIGYVILFKDGSEFNNMHDDDIEDYEDLTIPVDDWDEYKQSCSQAE